ncbi:lipoprotein-releasing system ATP-binding protein LolD [Idiomarina tyrosinivorans]|uniref:Lipoprotein-releasing system ATP-binding protein LolD n=1 Tax=Idiomarina tyrosinivorans TaxID=1445662 RepID=A0A432ZUQ1_9GAMM|nr:lipoprotein-releasing ABC transporter ATP-binding protein LolD [Idiomarina tyrosinivorans]RUO81506.1 lipoprotein-releasing system ATP-binding protein LolD [Idiomarina tyrosinivorans]
MTKVLLACDKLAKRYRDGSGEVQVLRDVSLEIAAQSMTAIVGSSGSGKSTLLHLLGGLDRASAGHVSYQGDAIEQWSNDTLADWRNKKLGFIYQFHHLLPEFTALENVAMPALIAGDAPKQAEQRAIELLEQVGLPHRAQHRPSELSGGERQRVAIARAFVNRPEIILADEPTGNLDDDTAATVYQLMLDMNQAMGTAFVVVTHDNSLAQRLQRVIRLQHGQLVEDRAGEMA